MAQEAPGDSNLPVTARPPGTANVVLRFLVRLIILLGFANLGTLGYARTLESLLVMATLYCVMASTLRREAPFGPVLTHFDEAAAYAACACIAVWAA